MKKHTGQSCSDHPGDVVAFREEVRRAVGLIGGKWKLEILWLLGQRLHRFNELRRAIPGVTQHMLTTQLRELERDGFVRRTIYAEVPPRVEYEVTEDARRLEPVFHAVGAWASERLAAGGKVAAPSRAANGERAARRAAASVRVRA